MTRKSIKIAILTTLFSCIGTGCLAAEVYTTKALLNNNRVWNKAWQDSAGNIVNFGDANFPISRNTVSGEIVYVFQGGNTYNGNGDSTVLQSGALVGEITKTIRVNSDSEQGIVFDNWNLDQVGVFVADKAIFGDNITIKNTKSTAYYTAGGAVHTTGEITFGNNVKLIDNIAVDATGGAAVGIVNSTLGPMYNITFGQDAVVSGNKATSVFETEALGGAIHNSTRGNIVFGDRATITNNSMNAPNDPYAHGGAAFTFGNIQIGNAANISYNQAAGLGEGSGSGGAFYAVGSVSIASDATIRGNTSSGYGGAIVAIGDIRLGNSYTGNTLIENNKAQGINARGGALFSDSGNIIITGSANITGNTSTGLGGAIALNDANNNKLQLNLSTGNLVTFRDNKATVSNTNAFYIGSGNLWEINYDGGGSTEVYDSFALVSGANPAANFVQNGNGITKIWDTSTIEGSTTINGGILALQEAVTKPGTVSATDTLYPAGKLTTAGFRLKDSAGFEAYDGAILNSTSVQIDNNTAVNFYGSGAINPVDAGAFINFSATSPTNIGNNNYINLAARTDAQIASDIYNKRGIEYGKYTALNISSLGVNNVFTFNSDIANNIADKLVVSATAAGNNYIKIGYDPTIFTGGQATGRTKTLVVEAAVGSDPLNLQSRFVGAASDIGLFTWTPTVIQEGNNWYIVGNEPPKPSPTVRAADYMANTMFASFKLTHDNLTKRMGELRFNPNNAGVWLRTYTGESGLKYGGNQKYYAVQGGIDKVAEGKSGRRFTGISIENIAANNSFDIGQGRSSILGIGAYQSWLGNKGHYYDLVGKIARFSNSSNISDSANNKVHSEYKTFAYELSMEYGYRKELGKGYFAIPQLQLTYRHIQGVDYTTDNGISISQGTADYFVGRAGITLGRKYNNNSQVYISGNIMRGMSSDINIRALDLFGNSLSRSVDDNNVWYNLAIGANFSHGKNNTWYLELEKNFGVNSSSNWQILLGCRWSW